jgi:tRNA-2-methylthio-N6-dimethylallyladenosine synthase
MISLFFKTYGCLANVADSMAIFKHLQTIGCYLVEKKEDADLIIVNTCAIRDKAEQKLFSYLGELKKIKENKPHIKIVVAGCVASYKKEELKQRFENISFVHGARDDQNSLLSSLTNLVTKIKKQKGLYDKNILPAKKQTNTPNNELHPEVKKSLINIMTGCNKYCSYCIVPFTKGSEKSFDSKKIITQIKQDIGNGIKEITLLGQNVNSYQDPSSGIYFPDLLKQIAQIEGEFWIRWMTPHPQDMTPELFHVIAEFNDKIPAHIHFPVQSGSNKILQLMNRNYTVEEYVSKIGWIKKYLPHATITTDIIVGFPGETENDYLKTRELMEEVKYDLIYSFIYSPRKYTKASKMIDNCLIKEKTSRLTALQKRQMEISKIKNLHNVGKTMKTLVEKRLANGKLLAKTEGNIRVLLDGPDELIGRFVDLKVGDSDAVNMSGEAHSSLSGGIAKW